MTRFEKWCVWTTSVITGTTGIVLGWMEWAMTPPDPWAVVNHPLQPVVLKVHILAAPLLVFSVGLIALRHVWTHFRSRMPWARRTGLTTALMVAPMVGTGYLIQVLTAPGWLVAMAIAHVVLGLVYLAGLMLHQRMIDRGLPPTLCEQVGRRRAKMVVRAARLSGAARPPRAPRGRSRRSAPGPGSADAPRPTPGR